MSTDLEVPAGFELVKEGAAKILFPDANQVFYNKPQVVNRDLSTLVIQHFIEVRKLEHTAKAELRKKRLAEQAAVSTSSSKSCSGDSKSAENADEDEDSAGDTDDSSSSAFGSSASDQFPGVTILEALSATGLRAIRYAKELRGVRYIVANDREATAVEAIERNVRFNQVPLLSSTSPEDAAGESNTESPAPIKPNLADAIDLMMASRHPGRQFDVVDLDPYGSAGIFLDSAIQAVSEGGLLCVTCTDMAVLCGTGAEAGFAKYGAYSLKGPFCHEQALRIVLGCMQTHASRHKRYIVPLVSLSIDFYVRIFVRVYTSPSIVKRSASKMASLYSCTGCEHFQLQRLGKVTEKPTPKGGVSIKFTPACGPVTPEHCPHCNNPFQVGGPIWADPIHDSPFVEKLIASLVSQSSEWQQMAPEVLASSSSSSPSSSSSSSSSSSASNSAASRIAGIVPSLPVLTPNRPLAATRRLLSLLSLAALELPDVPLYYGVDHLHSTLHLNCTKTSVIRSALLNAGYRVSQTHANAQGLKTDAPMDTLWDVFRALAKQQTTPQKQRSDRSPATIILSKQPTLVPNFTEVAQLSKYSAFTKFLPNPEDDWGPKARALSSAQSTALAKRKQALSPLDASSSITTVTADEKRKLLQNKKRAKVNHPCKAYKPGVAGSCPYGDSCKFLHADAIEPSTSLSAATAASSSEMDSSASTL